MSSGGQDRFVLRPATRADLDAVLRIEGASFSTPWSRRTFAALLDRETVAFRVLELLPEAGEPPAVIGHGIAWWVGPEAEIANVAVDPGFRGQGWGGVLVDGLLAEAGIRGVERVLLEVRESNHSARSLYEARGFLSVGRRRGYYRKPPEDALVMAREVPDPSEAAPGRPGPEAEAPEPPSIRTSHPPSPPPPR